MKIEVLFKSTFLVLVGTVSIIKAYQESQLQSRQIKSEGPLTEIKMHVKAQEEILGDTDADYTHANKETPSREASRYIQFQIF